MIKLNFKQIGINFKYIRIGNFYNRSRLARKAGIPHNYLYRLEHGDLKDLGIVPLINLADALDMPVNELLNKILVDAIDEK